MSDSSTIFDEIQKRMHKRIEAEESVRKMRPPHLLSKTAKKSFDDVYKLQIEAYHDACLMETHDMRILIAALGEIKDIYRVPVENVIDLVWHRASLDESLQEAMALLEAAEHEEREKEEKKAKGDKHQGDIEGQQKLEMEGGKLKVKDDGSEAEPASECTVTKVHPDKIDEILAGQYVSNAGRVPAELLYLGAALAGAPGWPIEFFDGEDGKEQCRLAQGAGLDPLLDELVKPELLEQIKSVDLIDAVIVLNHHFEKVCEYLPKAAELLTDRAIARWVAVQPAPETPLDGVIPSAQNITETLKDLGKEIDNLGQQKAALEAEPEAWDEPQRKEPEPEPEPEINPLKAAAEKKKAAKKATKKGA